MTSSNTDPEKNDSFLDSFISKAKQSTSSVLGNLPTSSKTYEPSTPNSPSQSSTSSTSSIPIQDDSKDNKSTSKSTLPPSDQSASQPPSSLRRPSTPLSVSPEDDDDMMTVQEIALSNCSNLHLELKKCLSSGSWWDKASLCQTQSERFWKCYQDYKSTLIQLGYKSPRAAKWQKQRMIVEAERIVNKMWEMEERNDLLDPLSRSSNVDVDSSSS
ncbi:hypothetical protein BKA69DRAFT_1046143 [Paraphysoderma sedebokerense]|nr:hypothetical protein BKA69DRAFT_1046143 [Paraphysoderma sedebokerense]